MPQSWPGSLSPGELRQTRAMCSLTTLISTSKIFHLLGVMFVQRSHVSCDCSWNARCYQACKSTIEGFTKSHHDGALVSWSKGPALRALPVQPWAGGEISAELFTETSAPWQPINWVVVHGPPTVSSDKSCLQRIDDCDTIEHTSQADPPSGYALAIYENGSAVAKVLAAQ